MCRLSYHYSCCGVDYTNQAYKHTLMAAKHSIEIGAYIKGLQFCQSARNLFDLVDDSVNCITEKEGIVALIDTCIIDLTNENKTESDNNIVDNLSSRINTMSDLIKSYQKLKTSIQKEINEFNLLKTMLEPSPSSIVKQSNVSPIMPTKINNEPSSRSLLLSSSSPVGNNKRRMQFSCCLS